MRERCIVSSKSTGQRCQHFVSKRTGDLKLCRHHDFGLALGLDWETTPEVRALLARSKWRTFQECCQIVESYVARTRGPR